MQPANNFIVVTAAFAITGRASGPGNNDTGLPDIVEAFACSDYCPEPEEKYIKRVYDGITDEEQCRDLGSRPYTFIGWGQHTLCEVR